MINSFKSYLIEEAKSLYFTFGRMNPPTIGHEKLMESMAKKSGKNPYRIYLSQSQDKKKNPLQFSEKVKYARKIFPRHARQIMSDRKVRNVFEAASKIYNEGIKRITMVVGSDRIVEFKTLLNKYNGVKGRHGFYNFENINVISAGERDPDAEGASGMSASKMRQAVMEKDFTSFSQGLPKNVSNSEAKKLYNSVRNGMGLKEQKIFKNKIQLEKVSNTREAYIGGYLFKEGDQVKIKSTNEIATIIRKGSNYLVLEHNNWSKPNHVWLDAVEMVNQMKSFKNFKENISPVDIANKRIERRKLNQKIRNSREKANAKKAEAAKQHRITRNTVMRSY